MAFIPKIWFEKIVIESNNFALTKYSKGSSFGKFKIYQLSMSEITLHEILVFHGILIKMVLTPFTGRSYKYYWSKNCPVKFPFTAKMSLRRFCQIRSVIAFNSIDAKSHKMEKKKDHLYKIRPILNILKMTLDKYISLGTDVSLDEATFGSRSSFGRHLIHFNAKKPKKFHYKAYAICCPITNAMTKLRFATRDNYERADVNNENDEESETEDIDGDDHLQAIEDMPTEEEEKEDDSDIPRSTINSIIYDMCKNLSSGTIVNTDNYYTSVDACIELKKKHGILYRGTVRTNRKFIPKKVLLTKKEANNKKGFRKVAVNVEHGIAAISWMDRCPVTMITTADGTNESTVKRREGPVKVLVPAPCCVKEYNYNMGGVDRHDFLRSQFSLQSMHRFKRYYVGLYLCLVDIALTNGYIHYCMRHEMDTSRHKEARAEFLNEVADIFLENNTQWLERCTYMDDGIHVDPKDSAEKELVELKILGHSPLKRTRLNFETANDNTAANGQACQYGSLPEKSFS